VTGSIRGSLGSIRGSAVQSVGRKPKKAMGRLYKAAFLKAVRRPYQTIFRPDQSVVRMDQTVGRPDQSCFARINRWFIWIKPWLARINPCFGRVKLGVKVWWAQQRMEGLAGLHVVDPDLAEHFRSESVFGAEVLLGRNIPAWVEAPEERSLAPYPSN
jgi:hypothetical protein